MRRILPLLFISILAFGLGGLIAYNIFQNRLEQETRAESTVLLEKVKQVLQLVTLEGNFSELYNEENYRNFTIYLPLPSTWRFSKSAMMQVQGKVLVGYNLENVAITLDSTERVMRISDLPEPEILAIDHQVVYRDLEESFFNSFSPNDYTQLNRNAKEVLRKKAYESGLLDEAKAQGNAVLESIEYMARAVGYQVLVEGQASPPASPN